MPMEAVMLLASGILDVPQKIFTVSGFAQKNKATSAAAQT
jgi:hypothetical protein